MTHTDNSPTNYSPNKKITSHEFAALARCAEGTLRNSRHTGLLFGKKAPPYIKIGRKVLYRFSDVNEFLDQFETRNNTSEMA